MIISVGAALCLVASLVAKSCLGRSHILQCREIYTFLAHWHEDKKRKQIPYILQHPVKIP